MLQGTRSPILFIIFNRPDTTRRVFESIRAARPPRLYVAADGPRSGRPNEEVRCREARAVVEAVDWDCQVFRLFRERNLGCKYAVSSAIDWFFSHEAEGIVLEDDCVPANSFFAYCDELLVRYRDAQRVMAICGSNFQRDGWRPEHSYYFSRYNHVWGWASWRRAWKGYDVEMNEWPSFLAQNSLRTIFPDNWPARVFWRRIMDDVASGNVDTWDYQWLFAGWSNDGFSIVPEVNLVKNIGFDGDATHTTGAPQWLRDLQRHEISLPLRHPESVVECCEGDRRYERTILNIKLFRMARKYLKDAVRAAAGNFVARGTK